MLGDVLIFSSVCFEREVVQFCFASVCFEREKVQFFFPVFFERERECNHHALSLSHTHIPVFTIPHSLTPSLPPLLTHKHSACARARACACVLACVCARSWRRMRECSHQ